MNIQLRTRDVQMPRNSEIDLARRVSGLSEWFSDHIARLHVTLKDVNGPRGGRDKLCIFRAELTDAGEVVVGDRSSDPDRAISRGARRLKQCVSRESQRRRLSGRRRGPAGGDRASA
jgi:hypothetical protein